MQKYLNFWYTLSLDLFGGEIQLERRDVLRDGPQGPREGGAVRGPRRSRATYAWTCRRTACSSREDVPLRNAMNEVLRDEYVEDCQRGVDKWNRAIAAHGIPFELKLPSRRFHRHVGHLRRACTPTPAGNLISKEQFEAEGRVAAERGRQGLREEPACRSRSTTRSRWRTGSPPPQAGHQGAAGRLRVRAPRGLSEFGRRAPAL